MATLSAKAVPCCHEEGSEELMDTYEIAVDELEDGSRVVKNIGRIELQVNKVDGRLLLLRPGETIVMDPEDTLVQ